MPEKSSHRFYLADLVAAVLLCGMFAALLASRRGFGRSEPYLQLMVLVIVGWVVFRTLRGARHCEECGRRFTPPKPIRQLMDCPHCGGRQVALARSLRRRTIAFCTMAPLFALFGIFTLVFFIDILRSSLALEGARLAILLIPASGGLLTLITMIWIATSRSRLARPRERACEACGGVVPAEPPGASICPNCRNKQLSPEQVEQDQAKSSRLFILIVAIMVIFGIFSLASSVRVMFNRGDWRIFPVALLLPAVCLFLAWKLIRFWLRSRKTRGLFSEEGTLAIARKCAVEEGTVRPIGPNTVWYSGPADPTPVLLAENAAAHSRFEALLGETGIAEPPLRIVCFHDRDALAKFYRDSLPGLDLSAQLGIYFKQPLRLLTLCTGEVSSRLDDSRSRAGSLYDSVLIEQVYGTLPAPWVDSGLAKSLAAAGRRDDLVRLNRRMIAALSGGTAWAEDLFSISANKFSKLILRTKDPGSVLKAEQFLDQAWSVVEYLCGEQAPEPRRAAFRAFLKDKRSRSQQKESFFQHFGFGFGSLLDVWRGWVHDQGIGVPEPPPQPICDGLVNRVLPVIRNHRAARDDRIQAIRDWRKAGFVLGADALIDLLREPGDIPKEEIVPALRMASGMAWGDDPDRWQAWWLGLPSPLHATDALGA